MDVFTWAILNVNCCQDEVCGWQQPLANCDTEAAKARKRKTEWVLEKHTQPLVYISLLIHILRLYLFNIINKILTFLPRIDFIFAIDIPDEVSGYKVTR